LNKGRRETWASIIKHYGFVIYGKLTDFIVNLCFLCLSSVTFNGLDKHRAYYGIHTLYIRNVLYYRTRDQLL
jgi:hypothetical protein